MDGAFSDTGRGRAEAGDKNMTYLECVEYINSIPKFTKKTELSNTERLFDKLGIDRKGSKIIHVAGTNGKGSVCTFMARILEEAGYKTALFISPHLVDLEERIQIDGKPISREDFCIACETVKEISKQMVEEGYQHPAYFEFLFGMAMFLFERENVRYIVLETGLGGRLDATNVFFRPLLTILTPISYDHMEILGDTLEQIAWEKAGIIKEKTPVVYWGAETVVSEVIGEMAQKKHACIYKITEKDYKILKIRHKSIDFCMNCGYYGNSHFSLPFPAAYQAANGALALAAIENLTKAQPISAAIIQRAFAKVSWPGRMEEVLPGVFVDGAHNKAGIAAFMEAVRERPQEGKRVLLFSVVKEKELEPIIQELCRQEDFFAVILTEVEGSRKTELSVLQKKFFHYIRTSVPTEIATTKIVCIADTKEALETGIAWKGENGTLFCVGSLYLVGQIKTVIKEKYGGLS